MSREQRFVRRWAAFSLAMVVVLRFASSLTVPNWGVASALGLLSLVAITAPAHVLPAWRRRLRLPIAVAVVAIVLLVAVVLFTSARTLLP
jgi:hypothetical protein